MTSLVDQWQVLAGALVALVLVAAGAFNAWAGARFRSDLRNQTLAQRGALERMEQTLRDQERAYLRELLGVRQRLAELLAKGYQAQLKSIHDLHQQVLLRMARLYQAQERRFGEIQGHLTADAGRLRSELQGQLDGLQTTLAGQLADGRLVQQQRLAELRETLQEALHRQREVVDEAQIRSLKTQSELLHSGMVEVRRQVADALARHADDLGRRIGGLTDATDQRLREINDQVERRLTEGFEKTTETFAQVLSHLSRIDEAQKKITELSSSVVSLQEVLADKRSRGAFGEVQLAALVRNLLPERAFGLQHTLGNGTRVDCLLFLPAPTGDIAVDAKFPLESFRRMTDLSLGDAERASANGCFRQDIRRHIGAIADKYIIPGETADGAVMFIPAEAVFAEIHAHHPQLVEEGFRRRVWMVSPTTMMAILTTARAVLKDQATREQVDIIQEHLQGLSRDFERFQTRMDKLARHIQQANKDVDDIAVAARHITGRFEKIEGVDLDPGGARPELPVFSEEGSRAGAGT